MFRNKLTGSGSGCSIWPSGGTSPPTAIGNLQNGEPSLPPMRHLSWQDFDRAVEQMAKTCGGLPISAIYVIPRGGLVLAVALSHRLELPLLTQPQSGCLVVDDVYETGRTLAPYRDLAGATLLVWISKAEPLWWQALEVYSSAEWIVFPWENAERAVVDEQRYHQQR
jgi:xanthine phosphoribosyltransferase